MALILHIETAAAVCSVALSRDQDLLSFRETESRNAHSAKVTLFIREVFNEAGLAFPDLDAVAVSKGPGSYTGLRIGVAAAKGLCYALDRPLIAVPTLHAMAAGMISLAGEDADQKQALFCPMLDARRMEVYCAFYDRDLREIRPAEAVIVDEVSFAPELDAGPVVFAGEGSAKCAPLLSARPNARFLPDFKTSAVRMIPLALEMFRRGRFEDPAYFEPYYLKEFVAGLPRVKGLE